ncbi:MAG: YciI family protein [Frankia sp.]
MFHVLILRYRAGVGRVSTLHDDHVVYLDRCHADGVFLASGQVAPDVGEVVLAVDGRGDLETVVGQDPLVRSGVADWEILTVDPRRIHEGLADLLAPEPAAGDAGWDSVALRQLRVGGVDLAGALADRSISTVLQHVGRALLDGLAAGEPGLATQA